MKVMKKILAVALAATMVMALAACGDNPATSGGDTASSAGSESSTGSSEGAFKIGGIGPLTGGAALYGVATMNGAQIAVDEINANGGINGYQIDFRAEDDQHDPEKSVNAYNSLKDWGMQMLCGTVTTTPCVAVSELTAEDRIFEITPSASSTEVIVHDNCFQVCFTDPNQGIAAADYIKDNNVASKVAVIYDSSDVYSSGIYQTFAEEAANQSFEIVSLGDIIVINQTLRQPFGIE